MGTRVRSRLALGHRRTDPARLPGRVCAGRHSEAARTSGRVGYTPEELIAAGLASRSERSRMHVVFHGRIMFPISNVDGGIPGFAGLATHLGPSWPMWLTSPDQGPFDAGTAIFGISQAAPEIARARRALVLRDCVQVLALHQQGRRESVAVIGSPITRRHRSQPAARSAPTIFTERRDGRLGVPPPPPTRTPMTACSPPVRFPPATLRVHATCAASRGRRAHRVVRALG